MGYLMGCIVAMYNLRSDASEFSFYLFYGAMGFLVGFLFGFFIGCY